MTEYAFSPAQIIGKRYQLVQEIGSGGMGTVYEVVDRLSGESIALKRVITLTRKSALGTITSGDFRLSLAQEFKMLASLRHPNIISVLDYGFDLERQPYFTMELLRSASDVLAYGQTQPFREKIRIIINILQALAYLHRRGIIHRDLKPGNILVANTQVKVLDFGLSVNKRDESQSDKPSGTLAYMSPEMLTGGTITEASDLYALGIIAHELLLNTHPFDKMNISQLISDTLHKQPVITASGLKPELVGVLQKLLEKQPAQRYANAGDVIDALQNASEEPFEVETTAIRESFLQAARFVGRNVESLQLTEMLTAAVNGNGGACLIGGESGVGKSRLVDELRTLALVEGVFALRGQAVAESGSPYQLWREALRWLCLNTDLSPLEASVLKAVIPDIATLIGQPVEDAPALEPQAAQLRLHLTIESVFTRQNHPILLVLEDLHWAGDSLALLSMLVRLAAQRPLLIVGTYRDDERPRLPNELPGAQVIRLSRLTADQIADLSESMVGSGGRTKEVIDLLERETEGNAFFLVEVMRALAESVGKLESIGARTLPRSIIAGGIKQIVQRRLDRVPQDYRGLLKFAAIAGRLLDIDVLHIAVPELDINRWLTTCAEYAVLEVLEGRWRFAHDKLREGLLDALSPEDQRELHKQVAIALEKRYGDADEYISILAYHWAAAGDNSKELHYSLLAGAQANRTGASHDAIRYYQRAFQLDALDPSRTDDAQRARWSRALGQAYIGVGNFREAMEQLRRALTLLGYPEPTSNGKFAGSILRNIGKQFFHRVRMPKPNQQRSAILIDAATSHLLLAELYYFNNERIPVLNSALNALNLSEEAEPSVQQAQACSSFGVMMGILSRHGWAKNYGNRALKLARSLNDPAGLARVQARVGLHLLGVADLTTAETTYTEAVATFERIGDLVEWGRSSNALAYTHLFMGRYEDVLCRVDTLYGVAKRRNDLQQQCWALDIQGLCYTRLGNLEKAQNALELSESMLVELGDISEEIRTYAFLGRVHARLGNVARAGHCLKSAMAALEKSASSNTYNLFQAHTAVIEGCLMLRDEWITIARHCTDLIINVTRAFPIALSSAWYCQGLIAEMDNQPEAALRQIRKSLDEAAQRGLRYEQARAMMALGRIGKDRAMLEGARDAFSALKCAYELETVTGLLNS